MAGQTAREHAGRDVNAPRQGKAGTGGMENRKKRAAFLGGSGAPRNPKVKSGDWRGRKKKEAKAKGDEASSGYEV
jgi:hypothetical protein